MTAPGEFLIYQSEDGATRIDVMLEAETLWLNQKQLTDLFGRATGWASLNSDTSRPFKKPKSGRIAVKVINHLGDEVMKVFRV